MNPLSRPSNPHLEARGSTGIEAGCRGHLQGSFRAEGPDGLELVPADRRRGEGDRGRNDGPAEENLVDAGRGRRGPLWGRLDDGVRPRHVIGTDDRQRISDPGTYPWRAICSLLITAADGHRLRATGWLAGRRLVVTAGHCVHLHQHGGWPQRVEVTPGRNGDSRPYSAVSTEFRSVQAWVEDADEAYDYGALLLPPPAAGEPALGDRVGYFGYAALSDHDLGQQWSFNLAGYPDDKTPLYTLWWHARRISRVSATHLFYDLDTSDGQSGSPLWRQLGEQRQVAGIHSGGLYTTNQAVRINAEVHANLRRWGQEGNAP